MRRIIDTTTVQVLGTTSIGGASLSPTARAHLQGALHVHAVCCLRGATEHRRDLTLPQQFAVGCLGRCRCNLTLSKILQ